MYKFTVAKFNKLEGACDGIEDKKRPVHCDVAAEKLEEISLGTHNYSWSACFPWSPSIQQIDINPWLPKQRIRHAAG